MQETWVLSMGQEEALEKGTATHSSVPTWSISRTGGAWCATVALQAPLVHGVARVQHD